MVSVCTTVHTVGQKLVKFACTAVSVQPSSVLVWPTHLDISVAVSAEGKLGHSIVSEGTTG